MGIISDYLKAKEQMRNYWREAKKKQRMIENEMASRFEHEKLPNESFEEFMKRIKFEKAMMVRFEMEGNPGESFQDFLKRLEEQKKKI